MKKNKYMYSTYALLYDNTYHPPGRVRVKPKRESLSTATRTPTIPNPCDVMTCPLNTDTRLHFVVSWFFHIYLCIHKRDFHENSIVR
jgi:hypothetical protein